MSLSSAFQTITLAATLPAVLFSHFLLTTLGFWNPEGRVTDTTTFTTSYDFIVIGAGSAGAVVANRLTEVPEWNVLLLEAGGDETLISDVPSFAEMLQRSSLDWKYKTVPQNDSCLAFENNQCKWPRGKVLGGSSVLNYMLYVRGNKRDYDLWASEGNTGWTYDDVLPYFKKSEDNRNPYIATNTDYHSTGGYLTIQEPAYRTPMVTAFVQGGVEMGYANVDGNAAQQTGFMIAQATNRRGARCSTAKAFLRPVRNRGNLHISMHSHVLKILIDPNTKQAYGVQFKKQGRIYEIRATKEVILSAGAINSPQLLMLSGVGPADHLKSLDIPVLADLQVGNNLQDHVALGGMAFTVDPPYTINLRHTLTLSALLNYTLHSNGPLTSLGAVEGLAWVKTKYADPNIDWPDIEFHFVAGTPASDGGAFIRYNEGIKDSIWKDYYRPLVGKNTWQVIPMLLRPLSRGTIRLASTDPYAKPLIDPKYFSNIQDLNVLIEGTKIGLALGKTTPFQNMGSQFYNKTFPGCESFNLWTDDYWGCFIRHYSATIYHYSGTCKMGPSSDSAAVVDPTLNVYGIGGLRVADASIMPYVVSGNTNAAAIMIGEKASDMIKAAWASRKQEYRRPVVASKNTLKRGQVSRPVKISRKKWIKERLSMPSFFSKKTNKKTKKKKNKFLKI